MSRALAPATAVDSWHSRLVEIGDGVCVEGRALSLTDGMLEAVIYQTPDISDRLWILETTESSGTLTEYVTGDEQVARREGEARLGQLIARLTADYKLATGRRPPRPR